MLCLCKSHEPELEVEIFESESQEPKDELFFIHGYADNGKVWSKQVEFFKKEYRCIVVTLPNFGKQDNPYSWGLTLPEVVDRLSKAVEEHSKKKQVTLIIHDWGSLFGFYLQGERPDLVSRIATLDIGGMVDNTCSSRIFYWVY